MKVAKIKKTTDFMVGGCNVCPTVKTDIYVLDLNGSEWPIAELDIISLITTVALLNGYKQYQEYGSFEDSDVFKKENNQVSLTPEFNKLIIKKGDEEEKIFNTYEDSQKMFDMLNQVLINYFEIEPLNFEIENLN